eukprot:UN15995
MWIYTLFNRKT